MKKTVTVLVAATVAAAAAFNLTATASAKTTYGTDYSRVGYGYVSVGAADFLERVLGGSISAEEREYLNQKSDFALKYNDKVAGKYVQSEFDADTGKLSVTPEVFFYEAVNGKTVTWQPESVNGEELLSSVWGTTVTQEYAEDFVTVKYGTSFTVGYGDVNGIINKYYNAAKGAFEKLAKEEADYNKAYAEYVEKSEAYQKYLKDYQKYLQDLAAYNEYVAQFSDWNIKNNLYKKYLEEYARYEKELADYNNYEQAIKEYREKEARYQQYLVEKESYDKLYEEYLKKIDDPRIEKELSHIEILDYLFEPVYINGNNARTVYGAVTGGTVTQVLSRLGEVDDGVLSLAKLIRKPIDDANTATKNLRDIFEKLKACKTDEDKYIFYISTYDSLKSNLKMLLQTLDYFFRNSFVRDQIQGYEGNNRDMQFKILLAQLFTVCNALDNGRIPSYYQEYRLFDKQNGGLAYQFFYFDSSYTIKDKDGKNGVTPDELLTQNGGAPLTDTNDALPVSDGYVPIPEEPIAPEVVEKPVQPQRVPQPVAPDKVENPGPAPKEVSKPDEVDEVSEPVEPIAYVPTEEEIGLAEHFSGGTVLYRNELKENYVYYADCEVLHYFRNAQTLTVAFFLNINDVNPEWVEEGVQAGSSVEYGGSTPEMTRRGYTCRHEGWQDANGNIININAVPSTGSYLKLYPYFSETPNMYSVIWRIDGKEYPAEAAYDSIPDYNDTYQGVPSKSDAANGRKYRFTGWDRQIAVMSDYTVVYTAVFEQSYLVTFKVNSDSCVVSVWPDEVPVYPYEEPYKEHDSRYFYSFNGWGKEVVGAQRDATYTAEFEKHAILNLGSTAATVVLNDGMCEVDCMRATVSTFDISLLATLAVQNGAGITLKMSSYTITFSADEAYVLRRSGAHLLTPRIYQTNSTTSGYCSYRYSVKIAGENDEEYAGSFTMIAAGYFDILHSRLYRIDGEQAVETRYTYGSNAITFSMRSGYEYHIYPQYEVAVLALDGVELSVSAAVAAENDQITITVGEPPVGRFIQRLYVLDSNGNEIEISPENTFVMPEGDVSVGVVFGFLEYTVVFKSDGVIIATRTCRYGDEVEPPQAFKSPDGEYSYKFIGWDKELVPVTGDAEYNAVFAAEPLPVPDSAPMSKKMQILIWLANHYVLIIVIVAVALVLIIGGIVLIVARRRRKKKKIDKAG